MTKAEDKNSVGHQTNMATYHDITVFPWDVLWCQNYNTPLPHARHTPLSGVVWHDTMKMDQRWNTLHQLPHVMSCPY